MKINKRLCWLISFGHWFKYYKGDKKYVRCRLCGRLPKSMWDWYYTHIMKSKGNYELKGFKK